MFLKKINTLTLNSSDYPDQLRQIFQPPDKLYFIGSAPKSWIYKPKIAIVGSRKVSSYGKEVTENLAADAAQAGMVVISGLAYGVDAIAHEAALRSNGCTVAVMAGGLDKIYPAAHYGLAKRIIDSGGCIISEHPANTRIYKASFIARNRMVSGLADGLLITEAAERSGTLSTVRFALEQGKTVMAVPGNINSPTSIGCNNLIKSGALPVTTPQDIFFALNVEPVKKFEKSLRGTPEQEAILELIASGVSSQEELAIFSRLETSTVNLTLTSLEIEGFIRPQGNGRWTIA